LGGLIIGVGIVRSGRTRCKSRVGVGGGEGLEGVLIEGVMRSEDVDVQLQSLQSSCFPSCSSALASTELEAAPSPSFPFFRLRSTCPKSRFGSITFRTRDLSSFVSGKPPSRLRSQRSVSWTLMSDDGKVDFDVEFVGPQEV
jgi:hypothetical protein